MDGCVDGRTDVLDHGAGLISESLGLMGSAAVGGTVQTRHVVCRKSMRGARYRDKMNSSRAGSYDRMKISVGGKKRKMWAWILDNEYEKYGRGSGNL